MLLAELVAEVHLDRTCIASCCIIGNPFAGRITSVPGVFGQVSKEASNHVIPYGNLLFSGLISKILCVNKG